MPKSKSMTEKVRDLKPFKDVKGGEIVITKPTDNPVRSWEIIADNLSKAGWSWGCVSAVDCNGRTIWIAHAHRDESQRFILRVNGKLTAFVELESPGDISKRRIGYSTKLFASITSAGRAEPVCPGILALSHLGSYLARSFQSLGFPSATLASSTCG